MELYALQEINSDIEDLGATLVAITPQIPVKSVEMLNKQPLDFDLLSDAGNEFAATLGLRHEVRGELQKIYTGFGIELPTSNGDPSWTLPVPARIVVDSSGIVRAIDADPDYTRRPEPSKTLADLKALAD
ncbi:MAG: redoxin domain-containing protein [Gammaproteobacteria bacterium]